MNTRYLSRIMITVLAGLIVSAAVLAAGQMQGQKGMHQQMGKRIAQELNLTDQQKAQIRGIMEGARAEAQKIKQSNATPEQKREQFRTLRENTRNQIRATLTPEQQQKFDKMAEKRMERGRKMMGCLKELNLTPEQKEKAKAIHESARTQIQTVMSDKNLTDQQKREKVTAIRKDSKDQFFAILTPEQQSKLKECWKK